MRKTLASLTLTGTVLFLAPPEPSAQELEPRLYQNAPVGLNAILLSYGFSTGNILFDTATLPVEDATGDVHLISMGYLRTFALFGRSSKLDVVLPFSSADFQGFLDGEFRTRTPTGFGDPRFRLAVNLTGSPALGGKDFADYRQKTIVGTSLQVVAPLGQYDSTKLLNLGSNRWSFRPEVAVCRAVRRWFLELAVGAWLFTGNDNFFGGSTLEQNAMYFVKGDVIYNFRPGLWLSFNLGLANGGETTVDSRFQANLQRNSRLGSTLSIPLAPRNSLKVVYTSGLTTRLGADFDSISLVYQYTWGGGGKPRKVSRREGTARTSLQSKMRSYGRRSFENSRNSLGREAPP
jgi:hypothetical protein